MRGTERDVGDTNATERSHAAGKSAWIGSINRIVVTSGALARCGDELAMTGRTSNPTSFGLAVAASHDYDVTLRRDLDEGLTDIQDSCLRRHTRRPQRSRFALPASLGGDLRRRRLSVGRGAARSRLRRAGLARRVHDQAGYSNLLVKIPIAPQGLAAIEEKVVVGIRANVMPLFSDAQYLQSAEAYLRTFERRLAARQDLEVTSVASVFVSRWDKAAALLLPAHQRSMLRLAIAKKAYAFYRTLLSGKRWANLAAAGARPQRLLWASTSTKDPGLPHDHYGTNLLVPDTVDTASEETLRAFTDHGGFARPLEACYAGAEAQVAAVATGSVDVDVLGESLQRQGVKAFSADWVALVEAIGAKVAGG